jgi:hypothetical protein
MACWVSQAEAFPLNGDEEERSFTRLDMGDALIAILDREGIDDKEGLEETTDEAMEETMPPETTRELLDCSA